MSDYVLTLARRAVAEARCLRPDGEVGRRDAADCSSRVRKHPECAIAALVVADLL